MCEMTTGFERVCDAPGGTKTAYGWNIVDVDTFTVVSGQVTAFTLLPGKYVYPIKYEIETATFTDTAVGERATQGYGREQSATIPLAGNTAAMIVNIEEIVKGRIAVGFELNDESAEVLFAEFGSKTLDARTPGTAMEDFNGNTLTFAGKERKKAPKISLSLITALLAPAS